MDYTSTRNASLRLQSARCFLNGISAEGGLYVPTSFPAFSTEEIAAMAELSYAGRASRVLSRYLTDFTPQELNDCIESAYGDRFDCDEKAKLLSLSDQVSVLELFHGPTLAFKDMALQILPHFLKHAKRKENEADDVLILVATSGDTGKAALEGFCNVPGMRIAVFYPNDGVSRMQQLQMCTQEGKNVFVCAVNGNFDDAQTGVKQIFGNQQIAQTLSNRHIKLSSANSINWGRLVPQIVYYFSAYADLIKAGRILPGEKINFTIPTGNFGDILAGYYAKCMGLPVYKLICASNRNNVLTDFFTTGTYDANRSFHKTMSPSMDILISSNLERLLFDLSGQDDQSINTMMAQLKAEGRFSVPEAVRTSLSKTFAAGFASEAETSAAIFQTWQKYHYCIDTHTAVAMSVQNKYAKETGDTTPTVVLSTASPYKFPHAVLSAISECVPEDEFESASILQAMGVKMPSQIGALRTKTVLHKTVCEKTAMADALLNTIGR